MVKMPSFDDIKKASAGLIGQAKSSSLGGMVDKMKAGIAPVKKDETAAAAQDDESVRTQFRVLYASLAELTQLQAAQAAQAKKIEAQIAQLSKAIAATQAAVASVSSATVVTETQTEEKKIYES